MDAVIPLREALEIMNTQGSVFSIHYHPFNMRTGKSGALRYIPRATVCGQNFDLRKSGKVGIKPLSKDRPRSVFIWLIDKVNGKKVAL